MIHYTPNMKHFDKAKAPFGYYLDIVTRVPLNDGRFDVDKSLYDLEYQGKTYKTLSAAKRNAAKISLKENVVDVRIYNNLYRFDSEFYLCYYFGKYDALLSFPIADVDSLELR